MHPRLRRGSRLPTLPAVAVEILRLFNSPDTSIQELTDTIQTDPALATRILKAANSPRYGARGEITDLRMGITRLGRNHITPLVLSFSLASPSLDSTEAAEHYKQIWLRSFVQATAAEIVAAPHGPAASSECFTISLLSGIGRLGLLKADVELYGQCLDEAGGMSQQFNRTAEQLFGIGPVALSVDLLEDIGLPERCLLAVRNLEQAGSTDELSEDEARLVSVTRTADAVARYLCDDDAAIGLLVLEESVSAGGDGQSVDHLLDQIHTRLEESAALFNVDSTQIPARDDLLESALEQLADFTSMVGTANQDQVPAELLEENGRLKRRVQDLIRETNIDNLTGVYNRGWFNTHLAEIQAVSRLRNQEFGVAVIDIDHFKKINDTHGHQAGDEVLRQVAQTLNRLTRSNETISRYGGEEFALVLEDASEEGMRAVGERLRSQVESLKVEFEGVRIQVTVSIGIACGCPTANDSFAQELFARADAALYEAKHSGRNQIMVDPTLSGAGQTAMPAGAAPEAPPKVPAR